MTERPILFQGPMVRSLLAGTKTQTRRVCKNKVYSNGFHFDGREILCHNDYLPPSAMLMDVKRGKDEYTTSNLEGWEVECPYGAPGDRLWVRETWQAVNGNDRARHIVTHPAPDRGWIEYAATPRADEPAYKWRPSIHMPRWACRILLEVTAVRVERLQAISESDCFAEGIDTEGAEYAEGQRYAAEGSPVPAARWAYARLWMSINGDDSWRQNPWVWVISFKRVTP